MPEVRYAEGMAKVAREGKKTVVPMEALREQVEAFGVALASVRDGAEMKAVHRLRTTTRRIEAQVALFGLLAGEDEAFALDARAERKVLKLLGAIRKAAGHVRDLDVQGEAVATEAEDLRDEAEELGRYLARRRKAEAKVLGKTVDGHARKLGAKLGKVLETLGAADGREVQAERLGVLAQGWFAQRMPRDLDGASDDVLHGVRKSAKLARYLAESGGLRAMAAGFEAVQEAAGTWHDNLALAELARRRLGKGSGLAELFRGREEAALREFRERLGEVWSLSVR